MLKATAGAALPSLLAFDVTADKHSIDQIELFRYDINTPRHFSWGTWHNRQHVFMRITSGEHTGWAEVAADKNNPELDTRTWGSFLQDFKKRTLDEAYALVKVNQVGTGKDGKYHKKQLEFVEMGLLDLLGRIRGKPAIELLGMNNRASVPGLYCILDDDLEKIAEGIKQCQQQNLDDYVKFKMFGKPELDLSIAKLARKGLGKDAFILSDANRGYKNWQTIDELADILNNLRAQGLNAIEDPAELTNAQWIALQNQIGDLALVPDYAMRPAWRGLERAVPGMGRVYNFHPESMGSLHHLAPLADKVRGFGGKIMIGDASLVGPACSVWQQIAIGVGAVWVEALEKAEESREYLACVVDKATYRDQTGQFAMKPKPGFGLEMDVVALREHCPKSITI